MVQVIGKVRALAPWATLMKVYGRAPGKAPAGLRPLVALVFVIVTGISLVITASAFAAESAKPNAVATVRPPKPVVAGKLDGDKPLCPPTKANDPNAAGSAPATGSPEEQKKDASGSTGNDLSVQLPSHEEEKEKDENRVSSSANGDSGDAASGESTSLQVRLKDKDKDVDVAPAVAPAQCTIPGATQSQEPPSPH